MLNNDIQPTSLVGVKRLAKQISKSTGLPLHKTLNQVSQSMGYSNFANARRRLQNAFLRNQVFFTVYWWDRSSRSSGREVLEIGLSKPLLDIASKSELKKSNGLGSFRLAAADHFVNDHMQHSREDARNKICKAVRVLRFVEATGLKPSRDFDGAYPNRDSNNKLPNTDHATDWYDPATGQFVLVDEPYLDPIVDGERAAWAKKHNWHLQVSKWPGMYYPYMTNMFVATDASTGYDFEGLMSKIDSLPDPVTFESWQGASTVGHDTFLSPLAITPQDKRRARAKETIYRVSSKKTVPLSGLSASNMRRPNAEMPIATHQVVARIIKAIQQSAEKPWAVNARLSSIKSELENWLFSEHEKSETDHLELFYYSRIEGNDPYVLRANSPKGVIGLLQELKSILLKAYVDCDPLRKMIQKIETSIKYTERSVQQ